MWINLIPAAIWRAARGNRKQKATRELFLAWLKAVIAEYTESIENVS